MKTIIFDMDGTLINSGNIIAETVNFVRSSFGLKPLEKNYLLENVNNPDIHPPRFFYESEHYLPRHIELFEGYYKENCIKNIELYEGILELLEEFNGIYRYTIATNANKQSAMSMIEHLKIDHFFELVVGADCVKNSKPHPDMIKKVVDDLGLERDKTIVIGDSKKDMMAAKSAGVESILVNWGFTKHNDAVTCIDDLKSILKRF